MNDHRGLFDVLIAGGGPAGAAMAIGLAARRRSVLLVDVAPKVASCIGEGLAPAANALLRELGVWEAFIRQNHLPSPGNASAWATSTLLRHDFIMDGRGCGWHLDRPAFDELLLQQAGNSGVTIRRGTRLNAFQRDKKDRWLATLQTAYGPAAIGARFMADCTGRRSAVARRLATPRRRTDTLIAFWGVFADPAGDRRREAVTLVEAVPEGWWYTAPLPADRRAVAFFTGAGQPAARVMKDRSRWMDALAATIHVYPRTANLTWDLAGPPVIQAAGSSRLLRFSGPGWLAAGDAAMAFDPLSGQGICQALFSGLEAAKVIDATLEGDPTRLPAYDQILEGIWQRYIHRLRHQYLMEQRWMESEFWRKRQGVLSAVI